MLKRLAVISIIAATIAGCTDWWRGRHYDQTQSGDLKGRLVIEWISQDNFLFIPDAKNPLVFKRSNNQVIEPRRMYTDGGSIPPTLRAIKSYSPWGYAPAFIIHDWLFTMKHCKVSGYESLDLETAATIMAEVMKTLMEKPQFGGPNKLIHYSMYQAVRSNAAQEYWNGGSCDTPTGPRTLAGPSSERGRQPMVAEDSTNTTRPRTIIEF